MTYDAHDVALWILAEAKRQGIVMTHMKLQKLLYYAQAYYIAMTGEPLFKNSIMAWQHGPVIPDVYHSFSKFGNSIIRDVKDVTPPDGLDNFIKSIIRDKGHLSAHELRTITHNEDTWRNAWFNSASRCITNKMISEYFSQSFWTSDEEDDFQPSFNSQEEEDKFLRDNLTKEDINAILATR